MAVNWMWGLGDVGIRETYRLLAGWRDGRGGGGGRTDIPAPVSSILLQSNSNKASIVD